MRRRSAPAILLASLFGLLAWAPGAAALTLSQWSSETDPSASVLDATLWFGVSGSTLTLVARNDTVAPDRYRINGIWWNGSADVGALVLSSASHSRSGDVTAAWAPVETHAKVAGFGFFDFELSLPSNGKRGNQIGPGEQITFVLAIAGAGPYTASDFEGAQNELGLIAAAKFVSGPGDRSAFGASGASGGPLPIPEPGTAALLCAGLVGIALTRRRR